MAFPPLRPLAARADDDDGSDEEALRRPEPSTTMTAAADSEVLHCRLMMTTVVTATWLPHQRSPLPRASLTTTMGGAVQM